MPGPRQGNVLQLVCLALLAEEPASGYDIRRKIVASGLHPHVPHGQATVYSALKALEQEGRVCSERVPGAGRPDQRLFRLSAEGGPELPWDTLDPDDEGTIPILLRFEALVPHCAIGEAVRHQLDRTQKQMAADHQVCIAPNLADWRARASKSYHSWRLATLRELLDVLQRD